MEANKTLSPIVTELYLRGRKLNISLVFISQSYLKVASQPSEFTTTFSFCCHGATINENEGSKILPTLFFMVTKTIKCKGKTES